MPIGADDFKAAMARWASGVTVVTASSPEGPVGLTASAFSSLSVDPPLVLVCVGLQSSAHDSLAETGWFGVHFLPAGRQDLSGTFAGKGDKFAEVDWHMSEHGVPVVHGVLAHLECVPYAKYPGGDHTILCGQVETVEIDASADPLCYYLGAYRRLHLEE